MKLLYTVILCCIISTMAVLPVSAQQKIRIQGTVKSAIGDDTISDVIVVSNDMVIGTTDMFGRFAVYVLENSNLTFYEAHHNQVTIPVDGRQEINIMMPERILEVGEVIVIGKASKKRLTVAPSDIEVKGNYFHLKTKFRIPSKLLKTDYRYIVQPTVYDVTKRKRYNLRPVVMDGKNYKIVQKRYLDYDSNKDNLNDYIVENTINSDNNIYSYADSMYINRVDLNNDFRADCYLTLVSYHSRNTYVDTVTFARGTQNAMRFFNYQLDPMNLDRSFIPAGSEASLNITRADSSLIPTLELKLMSDKGSTMIEFEIGAASINYDNPTNEKNINTIVSVLNRVQDDANTSLKSISMIGFSSPDGVYNLNKHLANRRTEELLNVVTKSIKPNILNYIKLSTEGAVQPWSKVIELVEQDSLPIANTLREILIKTDGDFRSTQYRFSRLPEYRKTIVPIYLPKLRKVEYTIEYTVFRNLTIEEISGLYRQKKELSPYEYFRLILSETNSNIRAQIEDDALKAYPQFVWVINRVAIRTLLKGESDLKIQESVLKKDSPMSMIYNQTLMALKDNNIKLADSLTTLIGDHSEALYLKAVVDALNGEYAKAYAILASRGGLNEILLMLGLKYNNEAYENMKVLMTNPKNATDAKSWYVLTLCANRVEDLGNAIMYMQKTLELDPSLGDIAAIDSDVMDIYRILHPEKKKKSEEEVKSE